MFLKNGAPKSCLKIHRESYTERNTRTHTHTHKHTNILDTYVANIQAVTGKGEKEQIGRRRRSGSGKEIQTINTQTHKQKKSGRKD